jgi:hypothetical protein
MGEPAARTRISGWLVLALVVALVAAVAAGGALVWARQDRADAQHRRSAVAAALAEHEGRGAPDRLAATRATISGVRRQLGAIPAESTAVADLSEQDAQLVQAALAAGVKGDLAAYNDAVAKRNDLAPKVDAAVEKLRVDVNAALDALAAVTKRTTP